MIDSWRPYLQHEFSQPYFHDLSQFLHQAYATKIIYPPKAMVFNAFDYCPLEKIKVVILGQDPYHGPNQAHGLSFSVSDKVPIPPSLQNIFKEIQADIGTPPPKTGNLERWAKQGVLLLNATLTVQAGIAASHRGKGWEQFTESIIKLINEKRSGVVYMLWGRDARNKAVWIDSDKNLILEAAHPSPLSAYNGFFGCRHFSQANNYLALQGEEPIIW